MSCFYMSNMESHDSIPSLGDVRPAQTVRLQVYLAWVDAWVSTSNSIKTNRCPPEDDTNLRPEDIFAIQLQGYVDLEPGEPMVIPNLSTNEMAEYFREENLPYLHNPDDLKAIIHAFRQQLRWRSIKVGGSLACLHESVLRWTSYTPSIVHNREAYRLDG